MPIPANPAIAVIIIGARVYRQNTGKPAFVAGGILGFLLVMVCSYVGIGIGRILKGKSPSNNALHLTAIPQYSIAEVSFVVKLV